MASSTPSPRQLLPSAELEGDVRSTSKLPEVHDEHEQLEEQALIDLAENDELELELDLETPTTTPHKSTTTSTSKSPGRYIAGGPGGGYNALKSFNGQVYTGMAVGGSHTWNYDQGIWKETKIEPDLWKIDFDTTKRRAKNAPRGSGAPEGMEYHWLIVAHQYVKKVDANTYSTHLVGSKYKLAHKAATSNSWSVPTVKAQRERELELLDDAKRRVQGLPPVVAGEKVKVEQKEKGQQKLDALFLKTPPRKPVSSPASGSKRKREEQSDKENDGQMAKFLRKNES